MTDITNNGVTLLEQIKAFCQERGLEYDEVMVAIERAIAGAYRKEFGDKDKVYQAEYDIATNNYKVFEIIKVVSEMTEMSNPKREITLVSARLESPTAQVDDEIKRDIHVEKEVGFGRIASQVAKQVLIYTINNFKHARVLAKFKDYIGKIVNVEIDAFKRGGYLVKIGHAGEQTIGYITREDLLPVDHFKPGQIIKALIVDITEDENKASRVHLSRSNKDFIRAIIAKEVPEVDAGLVEITKIVREGGNRTKLLVKVSENEDSSDLDPVGTILGRRNVRLLNIMREISPTLQEKIDVIEYQPDDLETMVADALEPAEIERIEFTTSPEGKTIANVYCLAEEASLAVGKRGANVRLAADLLDIEIIIHSIDHNNSQPSFTNNGPAIITE